MSGSFHIFAVMQAIQGYETFSYSPILPDGVRRHLDKDSAFQLALLASQECLQRLSAEKINAVSLDRLLLSQGVRSAVDYDVILEPTVMACHSKVHVSCYKPDIVFAYKKGLDEEHILDIADKVTLDGKL